MDRNAKVEVDSVKAKLIMGIKSAWGRAKPVLLNIRSTTSEHKAITALLILLGIGGVTVHHVKKKVTVTAGQICDTVDVFNDMVDTISRAADEGFRQCEAANEENIRIMEEMANAAHREAMNMQQQMMNMASIQIPF